MAKKVKQANDTPEPNEAADKPELTFEQAMRVIATTPKTVVDARMKQAKKPKK